MTQHPLADLTPPELRGYARGLRDSACNLSAFTERLSFTDGDVVATMLEMTSDAWQREADLIEHFAARLEAPARYAAQAEAPTQDLPEWYRQIQRLTEAAAGLRQQRNAPTPFSHPQTGAPDLAPSAQSSRAEGEHAAPPAPLAQDLDSATIQAAREAKADFAARLPTHPPISAHAPGWPPEVVERCRVLLVDEGLTHQQVAERTGVPPGTVSGWAAKRKWRERAPAPRPDAPDPHPESRTTGADTAESPLSARREKAQPRVLAGIKPREIASQLGIPEGSINAWASTRGWRKELAAIQARAAEKPAPAPIKPAAEMLPEDKAEAREKLRTGEFKGARAIIEEYGCTEAEALALVEEHRARMGKAA